MTSLLLVLLSQIDVYSAGVYQGRARQSVECLGCYVDGGRLTIPLDGGTGGGVTDAKFVVGEAHSGLSAEIAPASDDQIPVSDSSSAATWRSVPNCADTSGQHLNYTAASNSFSCGTTAVRSYLAARMPCAVPSTGPLCYSSTTGTTPGVGAGHHVLFTVTEASNGSDITLDSTDAYRITDNSASGGRFTLATGKTYKLSFTIGRLVCSTANCYLAASWFNADTGVPIGSGSQIFGVQWNSGDYYGVGAFDAIFTTASQTRVEVRIWASSGISELSYSGTQADAGVVEFGPHAFIEVLN